MEEVKKQQEDLRENVKTLKHKLNDLEAQNSRMEAMLCTLVRQSDHNMMMGSASNINVMNNMNNMNDQNGMNIENSHDRHDRHDHYN